MASIASSTVRRRSRSSETVLALVGSPRIAEKIKAGLRGEVVTPRWRGLVVSMTSRMPNA